MHKLTSLLLTTLLLVGCSDSLTNPAGEATPLETQNATSKAPVAQYEVTITNLTDGQPFTPPLVATHRAATGLFDVGDPASFELKEIAENGNLEPMLMALMQDKHVMDTQVAVAGDPPPLMPGQNVTIEVEAERGAKFLSFVSMLICTNDGFTGAHTVRLPKKVDDTVTLTSAAYDAGTEINTEDFADLVPPCPVLTGVPSDVPGSGMSNPALAEHGVIHHHPGVLGIADLIPETHDWTNPVAEITITRLQ